MRYDHFNASEGLLDPAVFSCESIYQQELRTVFRSNWVFLGPQRWLSQPGAQFLSRIGDQSVVVFLAGPRIEAKCVPDMPSAHAHVQPSPRLHVEAGWVFGCLDPEAPSFDVWMSAFAPHWQRIRSCLTGGADIIGDLPLVARLHCNWKVAAEAWCGWMAPPLAGSRSVAEATGADEALALHGYQVVNHRGALVMAGDAREGGRLAPRNGSLFPNLSFDSQVPALHVWHPDGVRDCQVWTYCLAGSDESAEKRAQRLQDCALLYGPFGTDLGDLQPIWSGITSASQGRLVGQAPFNLQMGVQLDPASAMGDRTAPLRSESNQRGFYDAWQRDLQRMNPARSQARSGSEAQPVQTVREEAERHEV
jgi:3-phenylpropionate/trans-cinnamate dioxygenase alpha subunit